MTIVDVTRDDRRPDCICQVSLSLLSSSLPLLVPPAPAFASPLARAQIIYLVQTCQLLVKMKRTELRVKARRRAQAAVNGQHQNQQQQEQQSAAGADANEGKKGL